MAQRTIKNTPVGVLIALAFLLGIFAPATARADEGGVSFWLPGLFGSLAATPQQPGWSFATVYYHGSVSASGSAAASREVTIGGLPTTVTASLDVNLHSKPDIFLLTPSYVFATPVLGGQLSVGMMAIAGRPPTSLGGTLTLKDDQGHVFQKAGTIDSSLTGFGDLYPTASLRWNKGVHNFMTYLAGDIPVGAYDPNRLANLGIGHGAIDGGVGYTYYNPQTGLEFSAVTGLTYNFENPDTNYRNGIDWHLDWGASKSLSKQLFVGPVGYFYQQISADSGQAAFLGSNESRVIGVGPQIGYLFPIGDKQGYLNLKGYYEFDSYRRADGWNVWLTFAISPAASAPSPPKPVMFRK